MRCASMEVQQCLASVKQSGGKVAALAFVIEIGDLNGGKLLSPHKRISLVVY